MTGKLLIKDALSCIRLYCETFAKDRVVGECTFLNCHHKSVKILKLKSGLAVWCTICRVTCINLGINPRRRKPEQENTEYSGDTPDQTILKYFLKSVIKPSIWDLLPCVLNTYSIYCIRLG